MTLKTKEAWRGGQAVNYAHMQSICFYFTLEGNGGDYLFMPTTVRFPPGSKPGDVIHVTIAILPDSVVENTESFQLLLSSLNPLATIDERMRNSTVDITDKNSK